MAATPYEMESDDWELVNDDGFVYKRKKRRLDPSALARPADPAPDPDLEARQRRERKRSALLKVRDKYAYEISLWEHLSNSLTAMEQTARLNNHLDDPDLGETLPHDRIHPPEGNFFLDELLLQVEGQEAIINNMKNLCDTAEALCDSHEENVKQSLVDLPVWKSPIELMASLSED